MQNFVYFAKKSSKSSCFIVLIAYNNYFVEFHQTSEKCRRVALKDYKFLKFVREKCILPYQLTNLHLVSVSQFIPSKY